MNRNLVCALWAVGCLKVATNAVAADLPIENAPPPKPPPSLAWGLRPTAPANTLRIDSVLALQNAATTSASTLTGGAKLLPDLGLYGRVALLGQSTQAGASGMGISNPLLFALWSPSLAPGVRLPLFVGATVPVGSGGGNTPEASQRLAVQAGIYARSALDNALMATNYQTVTAGAGLAWANGPFSAQAEATILQLTRVRGEAVDADPSRTNFTAGAHAGYRLIDWLTCSAELRLQRWLSTPRAVALDPTLRGQVTAGVGLRALLKWNGLVLRPGLAYFHPLDEPMTRNGYRSISVDLPIAF